MTSGAAIDRYGVPLADETWHVPSPLMPSSARCRRRAEGDAIDRSSPERGLLKIVRSLACSATCARRFFIRNWPMPPASSAKLSPAWIS